MTRDQVGHLWLNRVAFQAGASGMKRVSIIVLLAQSQERLLLCAHNWYILKVRPKLEHKQTSGKILGGSWTIPYSPFPLPTVEIQVCFLCPILSSTPRLLLSGGEGLKALGSSHQSLVLSYLSFPH